MKGRWLVAGVTGLVLLGAAFGLVSLNGSSPGGGLSPDSATVTWTGRVVVDSGGGYVGPWRMNRSDWRYVDDPAVALDAAGRAAVAWVDHRRKDVLFQRFGPDGEPLLADPVNVSRSPEVFSWLPRVVTSPDGERIYLLWQEIVFSGGTHGGEAFFARSTDGGRSFGAPVNLSNTEAGAGKGRMSPDRWHNGSLDLARGPAGDLYAAWTVYEGGLFVARSTDDGGSFSAPLRITDGGRRGRHEPARAPSLAVGPGSTVHLAWAVGEDAAADLRYAAARARPPGGEGGGPTGLAFGEPRVLFESGGHADAPKLAVAEDGTVHLAWAESPPGVVGEERIQYARMAGPGEDFEAVRQVAVPEGGYSAFGFPSLALTPGGDPVLVWELYPEGADHPRGLGIAVSSDGGDSFDGPALVPGTDDPEFTLNGSLQGRLMRKLSVGAGGRLAVVNSGFEPGEASRILLVRGLVDGR